MMLPVSGLTVVSKCLVVASGRLARASAVLQFNYKLAFECKCFDLTVHCLLFDFTASPGSSTFLASVLLLIVINDL